MERQFGLGMVDLFHPLTQEFNHAAVIDRRGGRRPEEVFTTEKSLGIHQGLTWINGLYGASAETQSLYHKYKTLGDKQID